MALQEMTDLFGDEELERVFESIGEAEDSGRLESVKREAQGAAAGGQDQEAACRTAQNLTVSRLIVRPPRRHSGLAGLSIPLNGVPSRNGSQGCATQIFSLLRKLTCPRTTRAYIVERLRVVVRIEARGCCAEENKITISASGCSVCRWSWSTRLWW